MSAEPEATINELLGRMGRAQVRDTPKRLAAVLRPGEQLVNAAACKHDGDIGLLAVTDQRVILMTKSIGATAHDEYPLAVITAVQAKRGRGNGELTLIVNSREIEIENINPTDRYEEIAPWLREHVGQSVTPAAPATDHAAQLVQLKSLLDAGVLTEAEFESKKSEILARM